MNATPAIEVNGLHVEYRTGFLKRRSVHAVKGLDMRVAPGAIVGFLGPNGAGKTTALLCMLDLLKPRSGSVRLLGMEFHRREEIFARVGYLPEEFNFYTFLNADDFLRFHGRLYLMDEKALNARIEECLALVGLLGDRHRKLKHYSKGMRQRAGIAQALLADPDVLFLDEPTRGLDPLGTHMVKQAVLDFSRRGKTVFINSHVLSEVEQICTHVAIMNRGEKIWEGNPRNIPGADGGFEAAFSAPEADWMKVWSPEASGGEWAAKFPDMGALLLFLNALQAAGGELHAVTSSRRSLEQHFVDMVKGTS
jgi:ABC-2 type transport system ATP-binding protein